MNAFFTLSRVALYLGIGLAVEVNLYHSDLPMRALFDGGSALSVYAHILAWPLFVLLWLLSFGIWLLLGLVALVALAAVGYFCYCWYDIRYGGKKKRGDAA